MAASREITGIPCPLNVRQECPESCPLFTTNKKVVDAGAQIVGTSRENYVKILRIPISPHETQIEQDTAKGVLQKSGKLSFCQLFGNRLLD